MLSEAGRYHSRAELSAPVVRDNRHSGASSVRVVRYGSASSWPQFVPVRTRRTVARRRGRSLNGAAVCTDDDESPSDVDRPSSPRAALSGPTGTTSTSPSTTSHWLNTRHLCLLICHSSPVKLSAISVCRHSVHSTRLHGV